MQVRTTCVRITCLLSTNYLHIAIVTPNNWDKFSLFFTYELRLIAFQFIKTFVSSFSNNHIKRFIN